MDMHNKGCKFCNGQIQRHTICSVLDSCWLVFSLLIRSELLVNSQRCTVSMRPEFILSSGNSTVKAHITILICYFCIIK